MARRYLLLDTSIGYSVASISRGRGITICRGALLEKTTRNTYVYHQRGVLKSSKFKPSQLEIRYHITADVECKKLSQHQFELLSAISEEESRYQVYATDRLEWGCSLEGGDNVFVKLRGADKPVAATICCKKENGFGVEIKDPNYTFSRDPNRSANFVTQAMQMNMDVCVTLDKLYSDLAADQTSDNSTHHSKCNENDNVTGDTTKLKYRKESNLDHSPRLTEEVIADDPEHNKQESVSNCEQDSYYLEKFEQERKLRMAAEEKVKELQVHNKFLESIMKKSRERHDKEMERYEELDKKQKEEIARLQKENDQLKRKFSDTQIASNQLKNYVEGLVQLGEAYQGELQKLQEEVNNMKQELDNTLVQKTQLEKRIQALEAEKEQLSSQVQLLSPTSQWKVDRDELMISENILGKGAWGVVMEGTFHGTKVAVKAIHQEIIPVADEVIQQEFNMMAQFRHPNLVLLIGAVFNDPQHNAGPLIITELLDGTLRSAYEGNRLDKQCRLPLLRDVAAALNYLHTRRQSFIHRDVSSTNVMLQASGNGKWKRAKLGDFGSAKLTSRATTPAPGAAIYSAPETLPATKGKQTTKVDVYSFGVLFCEVLLARLPPDFDPNTNDFSKFIADLKRLEGKDIHQTAHICTNRNPRKRPTMKDVLQDIDHHIISRCHAQ